MEYIVYSITCKDENVAGIYVGSTKDFGCRQSKPIYKSKDETKKHMKVYKVINSNGGWDNWEFKCLESLTCKTKEARIREQFFYDKLEADLNSRRPYISLEEKKKQSIEYKRQHKEKIEEYSAEYQKHRYSNNKEAFSEKNKQYHAKNKQKILEQDKLKYLKNRDNILEQKRQYYIENKEKIASRMSENMYCEACELYHRRWHKAVHYKTQKHIDNLAKNSHKLM
jgi:hypothetical protein